jgi:hypothetical protein
VERYLCSSPAITRRAVFDGRRREQTVPIPAELADELGSFRVRLQSAGDAWLFPQLGRIDPGTRASSTISSERAETRAGVEPLDGGLWHPYRRKWATERRHLPAVDVMNRRRVDRSNDDGDVLSASDRSWRDRRDVVPGQAAGSRDQPRVVRNPRSGWAVDRWRSVRHINRNVEANRAVTIRYRLTLPRALILGVALTIAVVALVDGWRAAAQVTAWVCALALMATAFAMVAILAREAA